MKTVKFLLLGLAGSILIAAGAATMSASESIIAQDQSKQEQSASIVQVEAKYVCMINNQRFEKEQIAIRVGERTYYGCCEMCKTKLQKDSQSRVATDPVSKRKVDKATAIIGAGPDGRVYYFENAENLKRFRAAS